MIRTRVVRSDCRCQYHRAAGHSIPAVLLVHSPSDDSQRPLGKRCFQNDWRVDPPYKKPDQKVTKCDGTDSTNSAWTGPFRFMDLPAEMRVAVYHHLLPHDKIIRFWYDAKCCNHGLSGWLVEASVENKLHFCHDPERVGIKYGLPLFLVSKLVSAEARAVLYGQNTFNFEVDSRAHKPISLSSPLIFGLLHKEERLHLLRNLRSIFLDIHLEYINDGHWAVVRQRARLQHFVSTIKQHADDLNQKSLLKHLHVDFYIRHRSLEWQPRKYMFALESLASLKGIEEVHVTGVEEWFAKCLERCMEGKGGDVKEAVWPIAIVKKKREGKMKKVKIGRKWYNPMLNWVEFAERNGIETPEDMHEIYAVED